MTLSQHEMDYLSTKSMDYFEEGFETKTSTSRAIYVAESASELAQMLSELEIPDVNIDCPSIREQR